MDEPTGRFKSTIRERRDKRMTMAKRGLKSLAIAVAIPLSLTILNMYLSNIRHSSSSSSSYLFFPPPMWVMHATSLGSASLMGLSSWLVWAESGLHRNRVAMSLYVTQLVLGLVWEASVFKLGAVWIGFFVCLGLVGALLGCYRNFKGVNPIAGELVKPCLAWASFLALVNLKLLFL